MVDQASASASGIAPRVLRAQGALSLSVSVMTASELRLGAEKAGRAKLIELVEAYLDRLAILDRLA